MVVSIKIEIKIIAVNFLKNNKIFLFQLLFFFFFFKASVALSLSDIPWNGPIGKLGFENKKQLIFAEIPSEHVIARA